MSSPSVMAIIPATAKAFWRASSVAGMDHRAASRWSVENIHPSARVLAHSPLVVRVTADVRHDGQFASPVVHRGALGGGDREHVMHGRRAPCRRADRASRRFSVIEIADPRSSLAVGTFRLFVDRFIERGGATHVDYVHGDDALERLALDTRNVGLHLPAVSKGDLLRMVVREGPLPRKAFSMGEAHEKRFYIEARRIRE
jgi:hypothetical protein